MLSALSTVVCFTYILAVAYVYFHCCRCNQQIPVLLAGLDQLERHTWHLLSELLFKDVTKFEFELRTLSTDSKFDEFSERLVVECEFVEKSLFHR